LVEEKTGFYVRLVLGVACIAAGVIAGQLVDQRLMLVAMFPAVALLSGVIASLTAPRPSKITDAEQPTLSAAERELMAAVWNAGELRPPEAAAKTSLSEEEAADSLADLAEKGYLKARDTGDGLAYGRLNT
jgi:hypothetical protein